MRATRKKTVFGLAAVLVVLAAVGGVAPAASGGPLPPTFEVISVNTVGCNSGNFGMTVERTNLDGSTYTVRTVVTVDELIYMNEAASISVNGPSGWNVFDNFTYGSVPNPGTYPIPSDLEMRLDFTLEQPMGTVLYAWTLVVDGCNTGNILYNGLTSEIPPETTTTTATTTTTVAPTTVAPTTDPTATAAPVAAATQPRFTG
jgi:hypothetical protein